MIFRFLNYVKPTFYYNLKPKKDFLYFADKESVLKAGFIIDEDFGYMSIEAQHRDLAWRAFQRGFISKEQKAGTDIWKKVKLPIEDEYRFLRKNFHKFWVVYVLLIRLLSFKNPYHEITSYVKTRKVKREYYYREHFQYTTYETFKSSLIKENLLISIIIPTLNRYDYLENVFKDLERQSYKNFEVIVVDQTDKFSDDFYQGWNLDIKYWFQEEKALWKARNEAIRSAKGVFILMSEDDIRMDENFIENHLKLIDFFKADVSCGVFYPEGHTIPKERSYFKYAEQFATGNAMLKKELFRNVGLFDRQFEKQRMGDGEFGLRVYLDGFKMVSNPKAFCVDLKAPEGGLRSNGGSWDAWRPKKILAPRPVPSVLYFSRTYFGQKSTLRLILISILPSIVPYRFKNNKMLKMISILLFPILLPLLSIQVFLSWGQASLKLKQGRLIDAL